MAMGLIWSALAAAGLWCCCSLSAQADYRQDLMAWFDEQKDYPAIARASGAEGSVRIAVTIDRSGHLSHPEVLKSSGFAALDDAALQIVDGHHSAPPFPPAMIEPSIRITVTIGFFASSPAPAPAAKPGYAEMDGKAFIVDGKSLAAANTKVAIAGTLLKFPSFTNEELWVGGTLDNPIMIGLLADNATRDTRLKLLGCEDKVISYSITGCYNVKIFGTAALCEHHNLAGSIAEPCLDVEDIIIKK